VTDDKTKLAAFINDLAVKRGDFTLTSGKKASFYIDLRAVSLDHRVAPLIGDVMVEMLSEFPEAELVGGLTMGADPIATSIMHRAVIAGRDLDAFVVRKEPKDHGMGKQVEGPDVAGKKVIVVEDTSTTGGSPLKAIEAVEKAGATVVAVAVVVDRDTGAKQIIEEAGYPYRAALGLADLGLA